MPPLFLTWVLDAGVRSASRLAVKELPVATGWVGLKSKGPAGGSNYKALVIQPDGYLLCRLECTGFIF